MQQHKTGHDVAGLPWRAGLQTLVSFTGHDVTRRLGEKHATHVAAPSCKVVSIKTITGDLGKKILQRRIALGLITC